MARRDTRDPREQGIAPNWAWAWPANRRDPLQPRQRRSGRQAVESEKKQIIEWNGKQWVGFDVPDYAPTVAPDKASARSS